MMGSNFREARSTIGELLKLEPENSAAKQLNIDIARREEASKKSVKKAAKKMFEGLDHDPRTLQEETSFLDRVKGLLACSACRRRKND